MLLESSPPPCVHELSNSPNVGGVGSRSWSISKERGKERVTGRAWGRGKESLLEGCLCGDTVQAAAPWGRPHRRTGAGLWTPVPLGQLLLGPEGPDPSP